MKDIRIFVASSKELEKERNYLAFLVLAKAEEFERRGFRVRLSKWEYVDPKMTAARTEDRYLAEMCACDAVLILFKNVVGTYTREEMDKAIAMEQARATRLKAHQILFCSDGVPGSDATKLQAELPEGSFGVWSSMDGLRDEFLKLVDRVSQREGLCEVPSNTHVRTISAFLAADEELAEERNAFADTVLNVNELLEQAHRNIRVQLRFYDPAHAEEVVESSEMGLVLYGTNYRMFGKEEIDRIYARVKDGDKNPKRFYVFFRNLTDDAERSLDEAFRTFRGDFVTKLGHFTCQFGDANALRLGFLLSLERYVGESVKEVYSTVSVPTTSVFVGREEELRRLRGLLEPVPGQFPAGRLPVITGAGGVGKSELVRQYASQLRVQYPGGTFQVNMENVRTWDEVFLGILDGVATNNGVSVKEYLGFKDSKDEVREQAGAENREDEDCNITGAKVRDALLRRARELGPILLVLDNVEGYSDDHGKITMPLLGRDGDFSKAFPAGFSERVCVNVVATARVCDVMLRTTDWAIPFPLSDLSPGAALDLLLAGRPDADAEERKAAGRVAELLGYRALFLRRVPALIGDIYAETICDSYVELAKSLEENLLVTVAEETEETHLPDVLWKLTKERLLKMPLGAECVKLVRVAAFFSPDGFPRHVLMHLWKTVAAPGLDEKKFARAFEIVRHYNLFQAADPVRVHRLDRAAILAELDAEPEIQEEIGKALAAYDKMPFNDWLTLSDFPAICKYVPNAIRNSRTRNGMSLACNLVVRNGQLSDTFDMDAFDGRDWSLLLSVNPKLANCCNWDKLDGNDWSRLLQNRTEFSQKCDWTKLWCINWVELLRRQPCFADKCPWNRLQKHDPGIDYAEKALRWVDELIEWDWVNLISDRPEFQDKCPWDRLTGQMWSALLSKRARFSDKCKWALLSDVDWANLLAADWSFADRCPWEKLGGRAWAIILSKHPEQESRCQWERVDRDDWAVLLAAQPQFATRCKWESLTGAGWAELLSSHPQFAFRCPWEKLNGWNWSSLLRSQPQFAEKVDLQALADSPESNDIAVWSKLLSAQPQFASKCPWNKLFLTDDPFEWDDAVKMLDEQPELGSYIPWKLLEPAFAVQLLLHHPEYVDMCDVGSFAPEDWDELLQRHPQLAGKRHK